MSSRASSALSRPISWSHTMIAPALISGLRGFPFSDSSWTSALNAEPAGSRPTWFQSAAPTWPSASDKLKMVEMLCSEKGSSASPAT
jgi:hypothetical protein